MYDIRILRYWLFYTKKRRDGIWIKYYFRKKGIKSIYLLNPKIFSRLSSTLIAKFSNFRSSENKLYGRGKWEYGNNRNHIGLIVENTLTACLRLHHCSQRRAQGGTMKQINTKPWWDTHCLQQTWWSNM